MSDRTQDIKNLRAVATACKNYTDKKIEDLKWQLGTYDLGVETVNGTTSLLPTPANTIQSTMVRVDGKSEVSANLKDLSYPTLDYKRNNLTSFVMSTSDTSTVRIRCETIPFKATNGSEFYVNNIPSGLALKDVGVFNSEQEPISNAISISGNKFTINTNGVEYIYFLFSGSGFDETTKTLFNKIGIFKTNTYEPYYSGIHNLELSGLKVEGANLLQENISRTSQYTIRLGNVSLKANTTYRLNVFKTIPASRLLVGSSVVAFSNYGFTGNNSFTVSEDISGELRLSGTYTTDDTPTKAMLNYGSTALDYEPYVSTTKTIDLSTILYNGSPLFEGNSLKAVGTAKDYITPYVAHKEMGYVNLGTLTYSINNNNFPSVFVSNDLENLIKANMPNVVANILCANYNAETRNNMITGTMDKTISVGAYNTSGTSLYICDETYSGNPTALKTALSGVYLVYELATPVEADINLSQLVKFEAHSNGSITLVNTNNQDTTSTFKYLKEVAK